MNRSLVRHGFTVLLLAFLLGFMIVAGGPKARGWMATHLTAMISGVFTILIGLAWDRLALSARQLKVLHAAAAVNGYWGVVAGSFATICDVPGPVSGGGAQPSGWAATVFFTVFIPVLTILPFLFVGLTIYGLRGADPTAVNRPAETR